MANHQRITGPIRIFIVPPTPSDAIVKHVLIDCPNRSQTQIVGHANHPPLFAIGLTKRTLAGSSGCHAQHRPHIPKLLPHTRIPHPIAMDRMGGTLVGSSGCHSQHRPHVSKILLLHAATKRRHPDHQHTALWVLMPANQVVARNPPFIFPSCNDLQSRPFPSSRYLHTEGDRHS